MSKIVFIILLIANIAFNTSGQIFLKLSTYNNGEDKFFHLSSASVDSLIKLLFSMLTNFYAILGILCYIFSLIIWIFLIGEREISFIYPFVSLTYVTVALSAYYIFGDAIGFNRVCGMLLILLGVFVISRS